MCYLMSRNKLKQKKSCIRDATISFQAQDVVKIDAAAAESIQWS